MSWDGVPWFVDGADHGPEVARILAYAAAGSSEGVIGAEDCKVIASAIPDGNIHIQPGGFAALNRFSGGNSQGYIGWNDGDEVEALTPQGAGGERWDLIAVIVQDPQYPGQPAPPSVPNGPYVVTAVYEDVPSTTRSLAEVDADQTGIALALVHFSASDGTVTNSDITDLRQALFSRSKTEKRMLTVDTTITNMSTSGMAVFPPASTWEIPIPFWATKVSLSATVSGVDALDDGPDGGTATGLIQVELESLITDAGRWRANATGPGKRTTITMQAAEGLIDVPEGLRGTIGTFRVRAEKTGGSGMTMRSADGTTVVAEATFTEDVI